MAIQKFVMQKLIHLIILKSQTNNILRMKEQSTGKTIDFVTKDTLDVILREYNLIE